MSSLTSLIPSSDEFCALRTQVIDKLLACRDGDSALLYLYLVRQGAAFDEQAAMRTLGLPRDRYDRAVHTLTNLELTSGAPQQATAAKKPHAPRYTAAEMRARREGDDAFAAVCQNAEMLLARTLTEPMLRTLMTAYEHLGFPADVLIDLLHYLHRENGELTRQAIDQQAHLWADMGVFTAEAVNEFLARREEEKPLLDEMQRALGMAGREPAPNEYRYLSGFIRQGFDAEAVGLAGKRMQTRLGKFSWKYLKGILDKWDAKGVHTVAEISAIEPETRSGTSPAAASAKQPGGKIAPPDTGGLSEAEREWLREFNALRRKRKEDDHGV